MPHTIIIQHPSSDSVIRGDYECPFSTWRNQLWQSLKDGRVPIKRGLEYVSAAALNLFVLAWILGVVLEGFF